MKNAEVPEDTERIVEGSGLLLTAADVATYLRIRVKRVYELVGDIAIRCGDRTLRWDPADLRAWVDAHRSAQSSNSR
jgi:hypothetical protein